MGGSTGAAVDKVTEETNKVIKKSTGGAVDLGSTDIQSQAENIAADTGIQDLSDNLVATADTVTKPFTEPIKKLGSDVINSMGLPTGEDLLQSMTDQITPLAKQSSSAKKTIQERLGLSELGQSMRSQQKKQFGRGQTARTLMTGKY